MAAPLILVAVVAPSTAASPAARPGAAVAFPEAQPAPSAARLGGLAQLSPNLQRAAVYGARSSAPRIARMPRGTGPARLLIAVRRPADLAPVARAAARHGTDLHPLKELGVLGVTAPRPSSLIAALRDDRRVVAIEPDRPRAIAAEPAEDVDPQTGIPFAWHLGAIHAPEAIAAVGGGSEFPIAVVDTGADLGHPDLGDGVVGGIDVVAGTEDVTDSVGHGTFVTGLIAARPDNNAGTRGVAGNTPVLVFKADDVNRTFSVEAIGTAVVAGTAAGAKIINLSLGGADLTETEARALVFGYLSDVLPVAAAGNEAQRGNPVVYPAALLGDSRGGLYGIGLSVAASRPDGSAAPFSTHNEHVSLAAPGAGAAGCPAGVFSLVPRNETFEFDAPDACSPPIGQVGEGRLGYSEGTSFAAPIVAGVAALAWDAEPRLDAQQVGQVLIRSADGDGWNERTGDGVVDAMAAVELARKFDITAPKLKVKTRKRGKRAVRVRLSGAKDRTEGGRELAGGVLYRVQLLSEKDGLLDIVKPQSNPVDRVVRFRKRGRQVLVLTACDANNNCTTKDGPAFKP
jgi:subtilisin family serine protease